MVRVSSETLLSREWRSWASSVPVRQVSWAGGGALPPSWRAGIRACTIIPVIEPSALSRKRPFIELFYK